MSRDRVHLTSGAALLALSALVSACGSETTTSAEEAAPAPVAIATAAAARQPTDRFLRVTGSLMADAQAEVSAETGGRVVETPIERGTRVARGAVLARVSGAEATAQLQEAEANAAQIEARLGLASGQAFDRGRVPEVMNARAGLDLAEAEFARIKSLLDQKVVSQSEYDQRRTQVEAARQQFQMAQNAAEQSFRSLQAARARVSLARKAMADTAVRAPFAGIVAERLVSVGDYVSRGTRVATVVRIDPLRVELTVPEQAVSLVQAGQMVRLAVDAFPGETFAARLRYVSPSLQADQRALTVEAIAANPDGRLKPGLFATASIQQPSSPGLLIPKAAIETSAGTSRVFVAREGVVQERIVTLGVSMGDRVEVTSGLTAGELVAAEPKGRLSDGTRVVTR